jgi:4-diphosphocytidyl-2-C-methyl-D-erythritol kinase
MTHSISAPAKLTTRLKITGVRADGYHLIDAEMVSLDFCDQLEILPGRSGIEVTGPYAHGVPTDQTNLVQRALDLIGVEAGVRIHKQIPHGGGLGGGSSDAAAILRWANFSDLVAAARIGADVAYCVVGGRALVSGIGETVEPLDHLDATYTLVIPPLSVSTPLAYAVFDELATANPRFTEGLINDLEPAALAAVPEMRMWRDAITEECGSTPTLAGSGATWFLTGDHHNATAQLKRRGAEVITARTVPRSGK